MFLDDFMADRLSKGLQDLPSSTFYRAKKQRANKNTYVFLIGLLQEFTKEGLNEFHAHLDEGKGFFDLACGETNWKYWSDKDKRAQYITSLRDCSLSASFISLDIRRPVLIGSWYSSCEYGEPLM